MKRRFEWLGRARLRHGRRAPIAAMSAIAVIALASTAVPCRAADPFYERRLREGSRELEDGDYAAAERDLRIAAFGLLDEPRRLVEALVPLALAQAANGDSSGFEETFARLVDVEKRFGGYREAELPAGVRAAFEERAAAIIPAASLEEIAAFQPMARRKREAAIARLPKRERREALEARMAAEPEEPRWPLLLGRLELEDRNRQRAAELASQVLARLPGDSGALCLRGLARAEEDACAEAVPDLEACPASRTNPAVARLLLDCLGRLERWDQAREWLADLPAEVRDDRSLERIGRQIARRAPAPESPTAGGDSQPDPSTPAEAPAGPGGATDPAAATEEPAAPPALVTAADSGRTAAAATGDTPALLTAADRATLARARELLARARTVDDLAEGRRLARDVADRNPAVAEAQLLAGEIAYRSSRWQEAADYFRRAGSPDAQLPELSFYMAVAFYEAGDLEAARAALAHALPRLKRSEFVDHYVAKILPQQTP